MELKTFEEFRSSLQQLPAFESIHQKERIRFLHDAYELAKARYEKETWMDTAGKATKAARASSTSKLLRVAKHLKNAIEDIEKAKAAAPTASPELMLHLQVLEADGLLRSAYDDLEFLITMNIAAVHSYHRTDFEKFYRAANPHGFFNKVEKRFSEVPARQSRLNYLLVAALSSRLDECKTSTGLPIRASLRLKIISKVFCAALAAHYPVGTVKTALRRSPRRHPN
jgi:hypothetical protein